MKKKLYPRLLRYHQRNLKHCFVSMGFGNPPTYLGLQKSLHSSSPLTPTAVVLLQCSLTTRTVHQDIQLTYFYSEYIITVTDSLDMWFGLMYPSSYWYVFQAESRDFLCVKCFSLNNLFWKRPSLKRAKWYREEFLMKIKIFSKKTTSNSNFSTQLYEKRKGCFSIGLYCQLESSKSFAGRRLETPSITIPQLQLTVLSILTLTVLWPYLWPQEFRLRIQWIRWIVNECIGWTQGRDECLSSKVNTSLQIYMSHRNKRLLLK